MGKTIYDKEKLKPLILEAIRMGNSLQKICKQEGMPNINTVMDWVDEDKDYAVQYARAREIRADKLFEEILTIADSKPDDKMVDKDWNTVIDSSAVQRNRLQVDARKWILAKMSPKKYGDKLDMTSDWKAIPTPIISVNAIRSNNSDQESS